MGFESQAKIEKAFGVPGRKRESLEISGFGRRGIRIQKLEVAEICVGANRARICLDAFAESRFRADIVPPLHTNEPQKKESGCVLRLKRHQAAAGRLGLAESTCAEQLFGLLKPCLGNARRSGPKLLSHDWVSSSAETRGRRWASYRLQRPIEPLYRGRRTCATLAVLTALSVS